MFIIVTYDVKSKRVSKVMKTCRKYLKHEQRSVFEGLITESKLNNLKNELKSIVVPQEDTICIYKLQSLKFASKEKIGTNVDEFNII